MYNDLELREILKKCKQDCGEKAIEMGFPAEAGHVFYEGCVVGRAHTWSQEKFILWRTMYGDNSTYEKLNDLYRECFKIMEDYGNQL